ncbi:MAG TPA: FMN-binding negative transcriptional regulator [Polyangia bacterium]|nr:FMN-binding negative transcriptional regulator [Polyangia bacterium]
MYTPESFRELDRAVAFDLIDSFGFATLVSGSAREPVVSHVPMILDQSAPGQPRLLSHVARANQHWRRFDGTEAALAIFHGPHAYVSPSWYANHPSVPTWNYAVVHVHGPPSVVSPEDTWGILRRLIDKHESRRRAPWSADLPKEYAEKLLAAIVGFQMAIDRFEAKVKLSQNKDEADRSGALAGLEGEDDPEARMLAAFARKYFERKAAESG